MTGGFLPYGRQDVDQDDMRPHMRREHRGLSAKRIARNVLRAAGLADERIDEQLDAWCARYAERYLELLAEADTSGWQGRAGAAEGLELSSATRVCCRSGLRRRQGRRR